MKIGDWILCHYVVNGRPTPYYVKLHRITPTKIVGTFTFKGSDQQFLNVQASGTFDWESIHHLSCIHNPRLITKLESLPRCDG